MYNGASVRFHRQAEGVFSLRSDQAAQRLCLRDLLAGKDAWPRFWDIFGRLILYELNRYGLADPPERDDLFQELALKLLADNLRVIRDYAGRSRQDSFAALLRVIVRNLALDNLRKRMRRPTVSIDEQDPGAPSIELAATAAWAANPACGKNGQRVTELLLQMTGNDRDSEPFRILYLRYVEQQDVNLIAERLGMKPNTVTQRIRYYLQKLRDEHSEEMELWQNDKA